MEILKLALAILGASFFGYNILIALFRGNLKDLELKEKFFLSFGLGVSFTGFELFVLSILKLNWGVLNLVFPWLVLFIFNIIFNLKKMMVSDTESRTLRRFSPVEKFLIFGILLEVFYVFVKAFILPIESFDAVAIYAIKAKSFFLKGTVFTDIFTNEVLKASHPDYPLLLPLFEAFIYKVLGGINDLLVKIIFPLFFVGTLAIFYSFLKRFITRKGSLLFTFFLATVAQFRNYGASGYADILISFYFTASILYLFLWIKENKISFLILSALLSFSSLWAKNEGGMFLLINVIILIISLISSKTLLFRKKIAAFLIYCFVALILITPWLMFKNNFNLENDVVNKETFAAWNVVKNFNRIGPILYEYQKHVFGPKKWNLAWLIIAAIFIVKFKKLFKGEWRYFTYAFVLSLSGYTLIYIISPKPLGWHLSTSASRILLHFLPLGLFLAAIYTKEELDVF